MPQQKQGNPEDNGVKVFTESARALRFGGRFGSQLRSNLTAKRARGENLRSHLPTTADAGALTTCSLPGKRAQRSKVKRGSSLFFNMQC